MKTVLARLYSVYAMLLFVVTSVFFLLPQLIMAQNRKWHTMALYMNYYWAKTYFFLLFIKLEVVRKYKPERENGYIICANHFSYLDIPIAVLIPIPFKFIGKSSVRKIPVLGYMFRKIHVMVDRESLMSRAKSIKEVTNELLDGFNMMFFPEGGVKTKDPPSMAKFRDGAFRLAVEHNLPILPVVLHDNYKVLPDNGKYLLYNHKIRISILEPIYPKSNVENEIGNLRDQVFQLIQNELNSSN